MKSSRYVMIVFFGTLVPIHSSTVLAQGPETVQTLVLIVENKADIPTDVLEGPGSTSSESIGMAGFRSCGVLTAGSHYREALCN